MGQIVPIKSFFKFYEKLMLINDPVFRIKLLAFRIEKIKDFFLRKRGPCFIRF